MTRSRPIAAPIAAGGVWYEAGSQKNSGNSPALMLNAITKSTAMVHHPQYVFNDDILPMGAAYWTTLTKQYLRQP